MYEIQVRLLSLLLVTILVLSGCNSLIFSKKGPESVKELKNSVDSGVGLTAVLIKQTRDTIFQFLRGTSGKVSRDVALGILQGTIGFLEADSNPKQLSALVETLIQHSAGPAREELIKFKDALLNPTFVGQIRKLLQGITHDVLVRPADDLLDVALGTKRQEQLDRLLRIVIPATLNDSAIAQIGKLRSTLVGEDLRNDIAALVDTTLGVASKRLNGDLGDRINKIVHDNGEYVKRTVIWILVAAAVLVVAVPFVMYWLQRKKTQLHQKMLDGVTRQIEKLNDPAEGQPGVYKELIKAISENMDVKGVEPDLYRFLKTHGIS